MEENWSTLVLDRDICSLSEYAVYTWSDVVSHLNCEKDSLPSWSLYPGYPPKIFHSCLFYRSPFQIRSFDVLIAWRGDGINFNVWAGASNFFPNILIATRGRPQPHPASHLPYIWSDKSAINQFPHTIHWAIQFIDLNEENLECIRQDRRLVQRRYRTI